MTYDDLRKIIKEQGGVSWLAKEIGISQSRLSNWLTRGKVKDVYVLPIVRALEYKILPSDIRPDLYPPDLCSELACAA